MTTRSGEEDYFVGVCVEHRGDNSDVREMSGEEVRFRKRGRPAFGTDDPPACGELDMRTSPAFRVPA